MLPPPSLTCPHGLTYQSSPNHVSVCKCSTRAENVILSTYLKYIEDPNVDTEEEYLDARWFLFNKRFANATVDGISLKDDENRYAPRPLLSKRDSWKSGKNAEEIRMIEEHDKMSEEDMNYEERRWAAWMTKKDRHCRVVDSKKNFRLRIKARWEKMRCECQICVDNVMDDLRYYF